MFYNIFRCNEIGLVLEKLLNLDVRWSNCSTTRQTCLNDVLQILFQLKIIAIETKTFPNKAKDNPFLGWAQASR